MWMYTLLPHIWNMSLTGSFVILCVLLARLALKKAPKAYSYALWAVVLFRLLCPVSFSAPFSLLGALDAPAAEQHMVEYIPPDIVHTPYPAIDTPSAAVDGTVNETLPQGPEQTAADPLEAPMAIGTTVWLFGGGALAAYSLISLLLLRRRLVGALPVGQNVYLADHIGTPFVMGVVRPKIYLPSTLSETERDYILLHERCHIRRLDHVVKLLAFAALCVHWFNPLVWAAFILSGKDMEMSCDEAVLKQMGPDIRADYSASLLSLSTGRRIIAGAPLAFGEGNTKSRIRNALGWKDPALWVKVAAGAACGAVLALCAANPGEAAPQGPFGHTYQVVEILYDAPRQSEPYETWMTSLYSLSSDHGLAIREGETWLMAGSFTQEKGLWVGENFESLFYDASAGGWQSGASPDRIRRENEAVWKLTVSGAPAARLYYLMLQKDGSLLLAQGRTAGTAPDDKDYIHWVFRLERTDHVTATVRSGGSISNLEMAWYPDGNFDFDYESLPTAAVYGSGQILFTVDDDTAMLTVGEDYYAQHDSGDDVFTLVEKETYRLERTESGEFPLPVEQRNNFNESAVYYVLHNGGKYVFRIEYPLRADTSGVTAEQVEAVFRSTAPGEARILDSVVVSDGAYDVLGVVLYQVDPGVLHLAYVKREGWYHAVGVGDSDTPVTPVEDSQLTDLGNGTVSFLAESTAAGQVLTFTVGYSLQGGSSHFSLSTSGGPEDSIPQGVYVTGKCLYLTPLSSTIYPDGGDGNHYYIGSGRFSILPTGYSSNSPSYDVDWAWDDDPFALGAAESPALLQGEGVRWQSITSNLALARNDTQLLLVNLHTSRNSGPTVWSIFTLVPDPDYVAPDPLELAISQAVEKEFLPFPQLDAFWCESHILLDTERISATSPRNGGEPFQQVTVYLMALCEGFHVEDGALKVIQEEGAPMKLTFREKNSAYALVECQRPREGAYYESNIRSIFPEALQDAALNMDQSVTALRQACYAQGVAYFGLDAEAIITKLFDGIESSPAASSAPGDYLDAHTSEYNELLYYGDYTLRYLFDRFLEGGQTGLRGHLMRLVLDGLAPESALRLYAPTGQAYFDAWLESAMDMEQQLGRERLERDYPAAWLAIAMTDQRAQ